MFARLAPLLLLAARPVFVAAAGADLRIHHRLFHPSLQAAPFSERAALSISGSGLTAAASLVPSEAFSHDLLQFAAEAEGLPGALYQVALEHPDDRDPSRWATSSVLACHLAAGTSEAFTVHLDQAGAPFGLDYFVGPVPHDGACPKPRRRKASASGEPGPVEVRLVAANVTVALRAPSFPPLPVLRVPPPVTSEGKPVEAAKEKSFLEKYWMYVVIALLAMMFAPAPAEEGGK
ncbi:uncharacterized protein BXZ73DRAFT_74355 [Epithele typhae]|uniref:uncharacterized protein n=1 Tax=Epithele typhae TaxID=378194 RepID=UPI002008034A|nr:uncharacterized protein BXZ73DRAFT_74355 [Epithele typhae]KAH9943391.1 hypothetical protein BXZ73DRAFT_74355 [Epithele typhae]